MRRPILQPRSALLSGLCVMLLSADAQTLQQPWWPVVDGPVTCMAANDSILFIGGAFSHVAGQVRSGLAAIDAATGAVLPWAPDLNGGTLCMALSGNTLYIGGNWGFVNGIQRTGMAALDIRDGSLLPFWATGIWDGPPLDMDVAGNVLVIGGTFTVLTPDGLFGTVYHRYGCAAFDLLTGNVIGPTNTYDPFFPAAIGTSVRISGNHVFTDAAYSIQDAAPYYRFARYTLPDWSFELYSPEVEPFIPDTTAAITLANSYPLHSLLALEGDLLYVTGDFTSIGGVLRDHLAALDINSGLPTAWNPGVNGRVQAMSIADGVAYICGFFTEVGGQPRPGIAAIDLATGAVLPWVPDSFDATRPCTILATHGFVHVGQSRYLPALATHFYTYAQKPTIGPVPGDLCTNVPFEVPFRANNNDYAPGNTFTIELSDANGDFSSPIAVGSVNATTGGSITATIPLNTDTGTAYRLRVVSSDPPRIGTTDPTDIAITPSQEWFLDADNDGYGDPDQSVFDCGYVPQHVLNAEDDCPYFFGVQHDACDDGNFNNYGDTITDQCECRGGYIRYLVFQTDDHGEQISWEIVRPGSNTVLLHGPLAPYDNNTEVVEAIFLHDGCYELRVHDSGGDGIGGDGGYYLLDEFGRVVINNQHNGGFGSLSVIGQNMGFCLPTGSIPLNIASSDREDWVPNNIIACTPDQEVSQQWGIGDQSDDGYQFWFFDPNGSYNRRIFRSHAQSGSIVPANAFRATKLQLNTIVTNPLPTDLLLNVRVRAKVNGVYREFGQASRFRMLSTTSCPLTQLEYEGSHYSCGVFRNLYGSDKVYAHVVTRPAAGGGAQVANKYQFEWTNTALGYQRLIASDNAALVLSVWGTNPLVPCNMYQVRVRASFDHGLTYCPWGPSCNVSIYGNGCFRDMQGASADDGNGIKQAFQQNGQLLLYPNPAHGDRFSLRLTDVDQEITQAQVVVFDAYGREVMDRYVPVTDGVLQASLSFTVAPSAGIYAVSVVIGGRTYVQRLVID